MEYRVAGIDVHKKMLAVVVADVAQPGDYRFERRKFGTGDAELRLLAAWLAEQGVKEAVMESTAQYWRPVWQMLEAMCRLHLAQAQSNRAPKGRKSSPRRPNMQSLLRYQLLQLTNLQQLLILWSQRLSRPRRAKIQLPLTRKHL